MRAPLALLTLAAAVALTGCSPRQIADFNRPAGASLDDGDFGNATMSNALVHTGSRAMAINLNRRFAAEVDSTINFAFDSAQLDGEARAKLDAQAAWIAQYPYVKFRVYGHTDLVGSAAYNKALGLRRARAAVNHLVSRGISRSRLEAVASYGETQPLVVTEGRERRNRRTVTEVWGFLEPKRLIHDGKYMQRTYGLYLESAQEPHNED
ncbi:outer membrane protein OmpA-like peptidoglycan-associated protein [Rhodovulum euryhalinum]|uniref:Outer membrane protein OmpA-like peptidoglycan-associated protein n=2 Tax=Rhodovulum euryhalinum TaxID=35805 RepID=A0A4R2KAI3_9RHOB|nr:outer membrane protein OmpA-like peptidoglycan-associated protein [Rhodovulum euryhalinum]